MTRDIIVGIGAGLAAALLFISPLGATPLAVPLFILSALPIAIAGLGWGAITAYIAAAAASAAVAVLLVPEAGIVFLLMFGGPAAWLCRLAGLSRTDTATGTQEWFPLGRLLLHAAIAVAIGIVLLGVMVGFDPEALIAEMSKALVDWLAGAPSVETPPASSDVEAFVRLNVAALPFTASAMTLLSLIFTFWLAGRIVAYSGRLQRPRERLWAAVLPPGAAIGFIVATALAFLPGPVGDVAGVFAGTLGAAMLLIGLAVLHVLTLGSASRTLVLVVAYVVLLVFGFPALLFILLGLGESFFHLRARRLGSAPPPI